MSSLYVTFLSCLSSHEKSMANATHNEVDPSPASCVLHPVPPLLTFISDNHLLLLFPTIAYWAYGLLFFWIDCNGYLSKYRLHTPSELLKRNRIPMSQVIYSILFYQLITTLLGLWLMYGAEPVSFWNRDCDIAIWATRIRNVSRGRGIMKTPFNQDLYMSTASWELVAARMMYYYGFPTFQFAVAIFVADTWQYFEHRVVHMNQYLYSE